MNIYDISKKAGVSIATVSRVLNGSDKVSETTRQKVLDVIRETNYTPNAFARSLGLNSMSTVGILCSDASDVYQAQAVCYLERELRGNSYVSMLCCTGYRLEYTASRAQGLVMFLRILGLEDEALQSFYIQYGIGAVRGYYYSLVRFSAEGIAAQAIGE